MVAICPIFLVVFVITCVYLFGATKPVYLDLSEIRRILNKVQIKTKKKQQFIKLVKNVIF